MSWTGSDGSTVGSGRHLDLLDLGESMWPDNADSGSDNDYHADGHPIGQDGSRRWRSHKGNRAV